MLEHRLRRGPCFFPGSVKTSGTHIRGRHDNQSGVFPLTSLDDNMVTNNLYITLTT